MSFVINKEQWEALNEEFGDGLIQPCQQTNQVKPKDVVAFFIGGAGDKESYYFSGTPHGNVTVAQAELDSRIANAGKGEFYQSHYLGYNEVRGEDDIQEKVLNVIPSKSTPIYIIGHSLGGWNGAHLSQILSDKGYDVAILVTLDPVGEGFWVWLGSDIYRTTPTPKAQFWINIRATPTKPDQSDGVADLGEQWIVTKGPNMNYTIDANHYNAGIMFRSRLGQGPSAADLVFNAIINYMRRR